MRQENAPPSITAGTRSTFAPLARRHGGVNGRIEVAALFQQLGPVNLLSELVDVSLRDALLREVRTAHHHRHATQREVALGVDESRAAPRGEPGAVPRLRMAAQEARMASADAPVPVEAGKSTVLQLLLRFHDPRRFGAVLWTDAPVEAHPLLAHLGIEPLSRLFDGKRLHLMTRAHRAPIKLFLMDARRIVGVGNIYASEALFRAGIRPRQRVFVGRGNAPAAHERRGARDLAVAARDVVVATNYPLLDRGLFFARTEAARGPHGP